MKKSLLDLSDILDLNKWEALQDELASVTKMGITTIDYKGVCITKHSNYCSFCKSVRNDPFLSKYCQLCDSRAGLEAIRMQRPYIYLCHFSIIDIAIPISVEDKYIGAIMVGQVKPSDPIPLKPLDQILPSQAVQRVSEHTKKHQIDYSNISTLTFAEMSKYAQMIFALSNYVVETSLERLNTIQTYEQFYQSVKILSQEHHENSNNTEARSTNQFNGITLHGIKKKTPMYEVLDPAFEYIKNHVCENVTQTEIAKMCHLSPGYFSRLFTKNTGETFTQYFSRKKIEYSKKLLEESTKTISDISDELGFSSPGYYIKVFKKHEGVTPLIYRKYHQES